MHARGGTAAGPSGRVLAFGCATRKAEVQCGSRSSASRPEKRPGGLLGQSRASSSSAASTGRAPRLILCPGRPLPSGAGDGKALQIDAAGNLLGILVRQYGSPTILETNDLIDAAL